MVAISNTYLLGDLAVQLEVVSSEQVVQSLAISSDTGLPLGRVLVLSGLISENDLSNLILCQSLLREDLVQLEQVRNAFLRVRGSGRRLEDALLELGWERSLEKQLSPLGELLVSSAVITESQLDTYLRQQERVRLPLGRMLVSAGVMTDAFLSTALNVQMMIRQKRLSREEAVDVLVEARKRQLAQSNVPRAKNFYEQPVLNVPKLGELLVLSGLLSERKLLEALELSIIGRKSIGEILLEKRYLTKTQLDNILLLQSSLAEGIIKLPQLKSVLRRLEDGFSLSDAIGQATEQVAVDTSEGRVLTFFEFLKSLDHTSGTNIDQAFEMAKKNQRLVKQALLISGMLDEPTIELMEQCYALYEDRRYSFDAASTLFEYSRRRGISVSDALEELRWLKKPPCIAVEPTEKFIKATDSSLLNMKEMAEQLIALRDLVNARALYEQLLNALSVYKDGRYRYCLERIAYIFFEQKDYLKAENYQRELTRLSLECYGENSIPHAQALNNLGKTLYFMGRIDDALHETLAYIEVCANLLGADHPDVACGWQNAAMLYFQLGDIAESLRCYKEAHKICRESLGPSNPVTLNLEAKVDGLRERVVTSRRSLEGLITGSWRTIDLGASLNSMSE
ncbi:MAG TPA: tetratricopeptide repeat protein [Candidatus Obscuribacter sp.]|nr:tetratricopeptide repeat protein [Candidatus Obscuribacter sp.]HMW90293.1 tetratricopeptide repeat protein [Candidatus Obscuribacter sp.]HMY54131.1 tetratricopeptide repeat protein [Candidatus Obscuribacter sp.]HNB16596.1 tetratricopeptide repeat protein [Candidatus Obscuribacter sp.]HND65645.1 tetratricopeptide repeat protein [Candidatus Obscuribacter sp.]